jgi:hypothetical protein
MSCMKRFTPLGAIVLLFIGALAGISQTQTPYNIHGWTIHCQKDDIHLTNHCFAFRDDLQIGLDSKGWWYVTIGPGSGRYPGSTVYLRIDKDLLLTSKGSWSGSDAVGV